MKEAGLKPTDLTVKGGRHDGLKAILSVGANQLLSKAELTGVLRVRMPQNWQDQNVQRLVDDFYQKYTDESQRMTQFQRRVYARSISMAAADDEPLGATTPPASPGSLSALFASQQPPQLPRQLPRLLKAITSQTPSVYKATVAQAVFPALATYPKELSFRYIDNKTRELRINCLVVAETGDGKDSSVSEPLKHILADMTTRDEANRKRLEKFNEDYNSKASNKEKPRRPAGMVIQTVKSDITKAALGLRMSEAQGYPLYVRMNELEQWDKVEGASGRNNQFTILKMIDDEENDFGSDRAGTQSVNASGRLHLNWNANTTPGKLVRYFRNVITDGPVSRLCLATIPRREIGADIPVFGNYDEDYDDTLRPYIQHLKEATGTIDCQQARRLARRLKDECAEFARLSQDPVFDNLTHRAMVHAFRKACLIYAANGMVWEKTIDSFCRWSLYYDLWIKMRLFGDLIRHAGEEAPVSRRGPQNLLALIPTGDDGVFTYQDAVTMRLRRGLPEEGTGNMLSQWKSRGHILQMTDDSFKKMPEKKL